MKLPAGCDARIGLLPGVGASFVFIAPPGHEAGTRLLDEIGEPGKVSALLTFDPHADWPDERGVALTEATLQ